MLADNAHMKSRMGRQRGRGGPSLLVGLLRCRRCGRMLRVHYLGKGRKEMRYQCVNGHINQGVPKCIAFGGVRVDQAVSGEILQVIEPMAIDAALEAAQQIAQQHGERTHALQLELEQARYEARLAARRYESADPENRLVASELEARWNVTLCRVRELESKLDQVQRESAAAPAIDKAELFRLTEDLPSVWNSPASDPSLKQKIIRILIQEIIADVVRELQASHQIEAVGIGAAGFVDAARANVIFAPNLAWRDEPLRDKVAKRVELPVVVENDANATAWGEFRFGAGRSPGVSTRSVVLGRVPPPRRVRAASTSRATKALSWRWSALGR